MRKPITRIGLGPLLAGRLCLFQISCCPGIVVSGYKELLIVTDSIPLREDWPDENMCSVAIRIRYGRFDYFSGGDMSGYPVPGAAAWHDEESDVARAIGPTDVHVVNHHGSLEEENPFWLATLRSRVMIRA